MKILPLINARATSIASPAGGWPRSWISRRSRLAFTLVFRADDWDGNLLLSRPIAGGNDIARIS
jgi:hypothetical protein